ncbi:stigma-specific STIG1-like protein 1 [Euphorbia lathyris]|uniref:stigma-specific STIG1-like protein 1 n=1 Tax=Euphorbia lathyris TaxID=212925 RepID=UPI003313F050
MGNYSLNQKIIFFLLAILLIFEPIVAFSPEDEKSVSSLRGINRFLAEKSSRAAMTCNIYPRVCRVKNSPGPDCCKKKCVNSLTDKFNCGKCGNKCKYSEICCRGKCVNPMFDKKNCGGCSNKCKKGSKCVYGMCSYA